MNNEDLTELVDSSPFKEKIRQLTSQGADYSHSNCHGTSVWTIGLDQAIKEIWYSFIKSVGYVHPNDTIDIPSKDFPGFIGGLPLELFLKEKGEIATPDHTSKGLVVFYQYTGRSLPLTQIEKDCGIKPKHELVHSAAYIGNRNNQGAIFHQEDGKRPFGFTTIQREILRRNHNQKYPIHSEYYIIK